ncbi:uncharacterized protein BP5553_08547 [Venustampulla echinocandica]|uniref:Uncharacterized protein n=1 Tax=Venustampulla echinocandica TaxID=2656787 RepID=A0A370TEI3_9HELO|nr:uncharacterized protein BP5553_08547 [Venustampulla echinocandica]RDL33108.1 hypothetical protein BP5553_08547 [Venustampulla echinocandica]
MYKWHMHSAIGRGRPIASDLTRVADGITASLRQFSVSLSRAAEDGGNDAPKPTRSQRSADALKEVSSLAPRPSRGIDARSLAAKPPQAFTIRRMDMSPPGQEYNRPVVRVVQSSRGAYRGQSWTPLGAQGGAAARGGMREGGGAGRGVNRGIGRGVGRGAGRGAGRGVGRGQSGRGGRGKRGGNRQKGQQFQDDEAEEPYNEEEKAYLFNAECGWPAPYNPTTNAESLARVGPPVISSSAGLKETLDYKLQVATRNIAGNYRHAGEHLGRINRGDGVAFFESVEQKDIAQSFKKQQEKEIDGEMAQDFGSAKIGGLSQADRAAMLKAWIGGQYKAPVSADKGDVLGQVDSFLRRNETYLPDDLRKLEKKLSTLLPSMKPKASNPKATV